MKIDSRVSSSAALMIILCITSISLASAFDPPTGPVTSAVLLPPELLPELHQHVRAGTECDRRPSDELTTRVRTGGPNSFSQATECCPNRYWARYSDNDSLEFPPRKESEDDECRWTTASP